MKLPSIAAALLLSIGAAHAEGLQPIQAQHIDLAQLSGIAYYTIEADGFHVVATFAHDEADSTPLRVQAVLGAEQSVTFSAPRRAGTEPVSVRIARHGEDLLVEDTAATD